MIIYRLSNIHLSQTVKPLEKSLKINQLQRLNQGNTVIMNSIGAHQSSCV